jgi:hypothetical protein
MRSVPHTHEGPTVNARLSKQGAASAAEMLGAASPCLGSVTAP